MNHVRLLIAQATAVLPAVPRTDKKMIGNLMSRERRADEIADSAILQGAGPVVPSYDELWQMGPIPAEILEAAEEIAALSDVVGLERWNLEYVVRAVLFLDRKHRSDR